MIRPAAACLALALAAGPALAQTLDRFWNVAYNPGLTHTWDTSTVSWLDINNTPFAWQNSSVDPRRAIFANVIQGTSLSAGQTQTVNLASPITFSGLEAQHTVGTLRFTGAAFDKQGVREINVVNTGATVEFANVLGGGNIDKVGSGTLVISGAAAYTGQLNLGAGTVRLAGGANRLPVGTGVQMGSFSTLNLNGNNQEVAFIATGTSVQNTFVQLGGATLTVNYTNQTFSRVFNGEITGSGHFVKKGIGPLTLTRANTYTGSTLVDGDLGLGATNALPTSTDLTILNGSVGMSGGSQTVRSLSGTNARVSTAQFTSFSFGLNDTEPVRTFNGVFEGAGFFNKLGPGTTIYSGTNTAGFGFLTSIHEGTLRVDGTLISNGGMTVGAGTSTIATLAGSGQVATPVSVTNLGVVSPGAGSGAAGKLTASSSFDLSSGGTYRWDLTALGTATPGSEFDQVVANGSIGSVVLGGSSKLTLDFSALPAGQRPDAANPDAFWLVPHQWTVLDWQGNQDNPPTSGFGSITNPSWSAGTFTQVIGTGSQAGDMILVFTPIPEPAMLLAVAAAGLAATAVRRRRVTSRSAS